MPEQTTLAQVIRASIEEYAGELRVCLPGRIEKYDPDSHLASIQPLLKRRFYGRATSTLLPIINRVPILHPRTASALLRLPVARGDIVTMVFADRSLEAWLQGDGSETDTFDTRQHHLSDAYAILGGYPEKSRVKAANPDAVELQVTAGTKLGFGNGTDELLQIAYDSFSELKSLISQVSQAMTDIQAITHTETGTVTSTPINAAAFATIKSTVDGIGTAVDTQITKLGNIKI